jgi:S1-C subfamily serine protease
MDDMEPEVSDRSAEDEPRESSDAAASRDTWPWPVGPARGEIPPVPPLMSPVPAWVPPVPPPPPPPPRRRRRPALAAVLAGILLFTGGLGIGWGLTRSGGGNSAAVPFTPITTAPQTPGSSRQPGQTPSGQGTTTSAETGVVDINTYTTRTLTGGGTVPLGAGTGMVLTSSGDVLTNNHVVEGAVRIEVTIPGEGTTYAAKIVGVDPVDDIALVHLVGASNLPTVSLGDSSSVTIGQHIVAVGNALGQGGAPTVTEGSVTGLDRSISVANDSGGSEHLDNLIQIDASISPGDSGGAVVTDGQQVVGMITAASTGGRTQRVSTNGYAIPVADAIDIVNRIRSGRGGANIIIGKAGFLGISAKDLDPQTAAQLGLAGTRGVLVVEVIPGTSAAKAGLAKDAVITAIDGEPTPTAEDLSPAIHHHKPGEQIRVTWVDQSGTHTASVTLVSGPAV